MASIAAQPLDKPEQALQFVRESAVPVNFSSLIKKFRIPADEMRNVLEVERERGTLFAWPRFRGQVRFWTQEPGAYLREQVLSIVTERAVSAKDLAGLVKKRSHGCPEKQVAAIVQQLLRDQVIRKYPALGREKFLLGPAGNPEAYAAAGRIAIQAILEKVAAAGASIPEPARLVPERMLEMMGRLEPSHSAPVSVRELRTALPDLTKDEFDQAARELRRQQRVFLSRHDFPQSLSGEDRAALIDGKDGSYYVAITARRE